MERKIRNQNGITIISLVITIIAMIIIASISIKMGLSSIKSAQDTTIETNLEIVQQAVTQQYSKAKTLNNLDVEADMTLGIEEIKKQQPNSFIGTPLEKNKLKERVEKLPNVPDLINVDNKYNYEETNFEDMYYLVSGTELKELGIDIGDGQEYIVNYSTGEVLDVTNESFTSGDPAYINGFTTVLDVEEESFVDTPINISIYEDLAKTSNGYKFSIKVTDEVAKITPDGVPEGNTPTRNDIENDPDDLNKNDVIIENIKITGTDPDNPITDGVTIEKKIVPDSSQGIEEYYIYEIVIPETKVDPTNPVIKIEILPDSVIDDKDNGNATTELTTSDESIDEGLGDFEFKLENIKYYLRSKDGQNNPGITIGGESWGNSAAVDLILSTAERGGLKKDSYVFEYVWSISETVNWSDAEKVTLNPRQGVKEIKSTIFVDGYTGKGKLYVRPLGNIQTSAGTQLDELTVKTVNMNLDNTPPEINVYYEDEKGNTKDIQEFIDKKESFARFYINGPTPAWANISPNMTYTFTDTESGLETSNNKNLISSHLFYTENENPKEINSFFSDYEDIGSKWYGDSVGHAEFVIENGIVKTTKCSSIEYVYGLKSGEYYFAITNHPSYLKEDKYVTDNCGNDIGDLYTIGPIKIDSIAPEIKEIEIMDDGSALFTVIDDYSGIVSNKSELETIYSKIKYAWIKETTIPEDVEWKSITNEQINQSIKNPSTNNIGEIKINVGTPDDAETYYLAVKLDNLEDIAGNVANTEIVSTDNSKKDVVDFEIENLELQAEDVDGNVIDGVMIDNELWGKTATFNISLTSTGKKGLKAGRYIFEYIWTEDENYEWNSLETKQAFVNVTRDGIDKISTSTIKLSSYTGKGYLYVKPYSDDYESVSGMKLNSTPKKVKINLDNTPPEFYLKYENENGVYEDILKHISDDNHFFRKGEFSQLPSQQYTYLEPNVIEGINDFHSGISEDLSIGNIFIEKDVYEEYYTAEEKEEIIEELARSDDFHGKMETSLKSGRERNGEILSYRLKSSGEYYYILRSFTQGNGNVIDQVGNKVTESYVAGPIKLDLNAPEVVGISSDENGNAKIHLSDDFSGLTEDYSKIKYCWVKSRDDTPTKWNSVKSSNAVIVNYNQYGKPSKIDITVDMPIELGEWYLAVKIENYEDIAGNKAGSKIFVSDDTYGLATDLTINIYEEEGLEYPKEVIIDIESESNKNFIIDKISYEHKGLDDKTCFYDNLNLDISNNVRASYYSTVNGPITVYIEDIFGNIYSEEYMVKNVLGTELVYDITEKELVLPLLYTTGSDEKTDLLYVNWEYENGEYTDGSYITEILYSKSQNDGKISLSLNKDTSAYHTYETTGRKRVQITGAFSDKRNSTFSYDTYSFELDMEFLSKYFDEEGVKNLDIINALLEKSRLALNGIEQFGNHAKLNSSDGGYSSWNSVFYSCKNLANLPTQNEEECIKAFENVVSAIAMFAGTDIKRVDNNFLQRATELSSVNSLFSACTNLNYVTEDLFSACTKLTNFNKTFNNTGLVKIPENLFSQNKAVTSFTSTFENCLNLEVIPPNLFKNNGAVIDFEKTFSKCESLEQIPEPLFKNNTSVTSFKETFKGCKSLTSIPALLFETNTLLLDCQETFYGCSSLTNIPEILFKTNIAITNFSGTFYSCSALTEIPGLLFETNTAVTNFSSTFAGCSTLTQIPEVLFKTNVDVQTFASVFSSCKNIIQIPQKLFWTNDDVTSFAGSFYGNQTITGIPEELFFYNDDVTNFSSVFESCTSLKNIPEFLFSKNFSVTTFSEAFRDDVSVTTIPEKLFEKNDQVQDFSRVFYNVSILQIYKDIFVSSKENITNLSGAFSYCDLLVLDENNKGMFMDYKAVEYFSDIFANCRSINMIPENIFLNCTAATDFTRAFLGTSISEIDSSFWGGNLSANKVDEMFAECLYLKEVKNNGKGVFEVNPSIKSMKSTFKKCTALYKVDSYTFKNCSNVYDIGAIFYNCTALNILGNTAFDDMLNLVKLNSLDKNTVDGVSIERYYGAFQNCSSLPQEQCPPLWDWFAVSPDTYNTFCGTSFFDSSSEWGIFYGAEHY